MLFNRGYAMNIGNCAKKFLKQNNKNGFENKPTSYIVKLNDTIKIGDCNNLYNRLSTYNTMYKNVEILHARGFPIDESNNNKYNKIFTKRLVKYNDNRYFHNSSCETTILKTVKDLTTGKFKILDMD